MATWRIIRSGAAFILGYHHGMIALSRRRLLTGAVTWFGALSWAATAHPAEKPSITVYKDPT